MIRQDDKARGIGASAVPPKVAFWSQEGKGCGSDHHFGVPFASGTLSTTGLLGEVFATGKQQQLSSCMDLGGWKSTSEMFHPSTAMLLLGDVRFGEDKGEPRPKRQTREVLSGITDTASAAEGV